MTELGKVVDMTPSTDRDTVDPTTLSSEQLAKMLDERTGNAGKTEQAEEPTPETTGSAVENEPTAKEKEKGKEAAAKPDTLQAELEKLQKQVQEKETMLQRQANELGELRKAKEAPQATPQAEPGKNWVDKLLEDPQKAVAEIVEAEIAKRSSQESAKRQAKGAVEQYVKTKHADFDALLPTIAELAKEDGFPEDNIKQFLNDPYGENPVLLVNYAERAKLRKRIDELEKKPEDVVKRIADATRKATVRPSGVSSSSRPRDFSESQIADMTPAQLEEALKRRLAAEVS